MLCGYGDDHFRSSSKNQDAQRGFASRVHLTPAAEPRLLAAKLKRGFPHVSVAIPTSELSHVCYDLCRYNIAKTRLLRRGSSIGASESPTNGRYYEFQQVPVARREEDKEAMLEKHVPLGTMIEVLIDKHLELPRNTEIIAYSKDDLILSQEILTRLDLPWVSRLENSSVYVRSEIHANAVEFYVKSVLSGDQSVAEIEFDQL